MTCGTGLITRRNKILVQTAYGGSVCPPLSDSKECNLVECRKVGEMVRYFQKQKLLVENATKATKLVVPAHQGTKIHVSEVGDEAGGEYMEGGEVVGMDDAPNASPVHVGVDVHVGDAEPERASCGEAGVQSAGENEERPSKRPRRAAAQIGRAHV